MKPLVITICIILFYQLASGQIGGASGFEFINIPADTRLSSEGGVNVSFSDWDANMFFSNPAALNDQMYGNLSFNHTFYYAGVNLNRLAYVHTFEKSGSWGFGIQNINYGKIDGYDPAGNAIGEFNSSDLALVAGNSQRIGNFSVGVNAKWLYSNIAAYKASAFLFDLGGLFIHPTADLKVGINIKNLGFKIVDYTETSDTKLPFDVQVGASFKPEHMPLRFSITAYNLNKGDILYYDEASNLIRNEPNTFDKIISHMSFGAELIVSQNVHIRGGYNSLIRQELKLQNKAGGSGFSFGLMFRIKAFEFSYSRAIYHVAGGINYIGLTSNLSTFYKRKEIDN